MINNIISCEFNIDTACVEVKFNDGYVVSINRNDIEVDIYPKKINDIKI